MSDTTRDTNPGIKDLLLDRIDSLESFVIALDKLRSARTFHFFQDTDELRITRLNNRWLADRNELVIDLRFVPV